MMKSILFVCVENANRSQMAEAFARMHGQGRVVALSAGSKPSGRINPKAIQAMRERGYDLTTHQSKSLAAFDGMEIDVVVTMGCGDACPLVKARWHEAWTIPDPKAMPPEAFTQVRDLIETKVQNLLRNLWEEQIPMSHQLQQIVQEKYGTVASSSLSSDHAGVRAVEQAFGYSPEELAAIPAAANMGLSCGNPTATARLRPGEVVVDLGCGGGLDVFLAAAKVGPTGKAIGIDMTPEMLDRARRNAAQGNDGQPITNVEFIEATIDRIPLQDASVDCVISNCVINLAPDKPAVFREVARILKPGGRLAVSDIALKQPLPPEVGQDIMAYVGCIAGALLIEEYRQQLLEAGFAAVEILDTGADLNAYAQVEQAEGCCAANASPSGISLCCGSSTSQDDPFHQRVAALLTRYNVNDYAASVKVFAVKPAG